MNEDNINGQKQETTSVSEPSNRPSHRSEFESPEPAEKATSLGGKGDDSTPFLGISFPAARIVPSKKTRLMRQQLEAIEQRLSARDHAVLQAIRKYRFLTSVQIGKLYVTECSTKTSMTRNRNLLLKRLGNYGLIRALERRIGGFGGGSSVQVWYLTEAGYRLLTLNDPDTYPRKRYSEPSPLFLAHTLAIAECAIQMTCLCRNSEDLKLEQVDTEPSCWRKFMDEDRRINQLKPDLFAITNYGRYEDRWFIEMDLGTESSVQIVEKCNIYLWYYYTGIEQKETGMFPLVVWIAKDAARKECLKQYICENIKAQPKMFLVITPDELEKMLRQDIETKELC